jgi:hypothetical protein
MQTQQVKSEFSQKLLLANETKSFNTTKTQEATMGLNLFILIKVIISKLFINNFTSLISISLLFSTSTKGT